MKKKILVAGGTGYIGSHTTVELQNAGYEVVIIDDLSNSNMEVLDGIERITGKLWKLIRVLTVLFCLLPAKRWVSQFSSR